MPAMNLDAFLATIAEDAVFLPPNSEPIVRGDAAGGAVARPER
jgi:hypothetical protein